MAARTTTRRRSTAGAMDIDAALRLTSADATIAIVGMGKLGGRELNYSSDVDVLFVHDGDTLFLDGCGRTDLPGSDPEQMYLSLTQRLAQVPDDAVLFPGHLYSEKPSATMAETRSRNVVFRPQSLEQWLMMFAR